jgi:hypothetical protein
VTSLPLRVDSGPVALVPGPSARAPWVLALLPRCIHARRARVWGPGATRTAAAQQALPRTPTSSSAVHHKKTALASPQSAGASALARPFGAAPREPQRPTSTASCAMHCTPLAQDLQRHAHHTCAGPRPIATPVQNARATPTGLTPRLHADRCWRHRDSGVGVERQREVPGASGVAAVVPARARCGCRT